MNTRRVVITGMGLITPLGNDLNTSWDAIKNGKSGIETLDHFDVSAFSTPVSYTHLTLPTKA